MTRTHGPGARSRGPIRPRIRSSITVLTATVVSMVTLCARGAASTLTASGPSASAAVPQSPPPVCPNGYSWVAIPCPHAPCPTAEVGPSSGLVGSLAQPQSVFVDLYQYPVGDTPTVYYCSDTAPITSRAPLCEPTPVQLPILPDGTSAGSQQVIEVQNNGAAPLSGFVPNGTTSGTFFCDTGANPCSVDIFDPALDRSRTPDANNTIVVPVQFLADSSGCPNGTVLNTVSDFGIEGLLSRIAPLSCTGAQPTVAVNTAQDSLAAVQALASGTAQIAFTDDPEAADEQSALAGIHHAFIPVAVSADVLGFLAQNTLSTNFRLNFPESTMRLTRTWSRDSSLTSTTATSAPPMRSLAPRAPTRCSRLRPSPRALRWRCSTQYPASSPIRDSARISAATTPA